jgi:hypothetical protein
MTAVFGALAMAAANGGTEGTTQRDWAWALSVTAIGALGLALVAIAEWIIGRARRLTEERAFRSGRAPAGWYRNPDDPQRARWWDGERWAEPESK